MLERLLALLTTSSPLSTAQLARRLEVGPALVEQMLSDLVRAGYLQEVPGAGQAACTDCSGCAVRSDCTHPRLWIRTAKPAVPVTGSTAI